MSDGKAVSMLPIEEWKKRNKVPEAVYEGMRVMNGWKPGRCVAETEFLNAQKNFLAGSADGRKSSESKSKKKGA